MKTKLFFTFAITIILNFSYGQDTIPNHNFENWESTYHPDNWETTNLLLPPGINNCYQITNSHSGLYALHLKSIDLEGMIVPGVATTGSLEIFTTAGGVPFSAKPIALRGYYQHPSAGDEILIGIEFFKDGEEIGGGVLINTDSVPDYTEFVIPITFYSNQNPDTLLITILTDQNKVGSNVTIDDLEFEYELTSVFDINQSESEFHVFPNPSMGLITIETDSALENIIIYDLNGRVVQQIINPTNIINVDLRELLPGIYTIICIADKKVSSQKLIIQ